MYRNLKILHMTEFFSTDTVRESVTNIRSVNVQKNVKSEGKILGKDERLEAAAFQIVYSGYLTSFIAIAWRKDIKGGSNKGSETAAFQIACSGYYFIHCNCMEKDIKGSNKGSDVAVQDIRLLSLQLQRKERYEMRVQ